MKRRQVAGEFAIVRRAEPVSGSVATSQLGALENHRDDTVRCDSRFLGQKQIRPTAPCSRFDLPNGIRRALQMALTTYACR